MVAPLSANYSQAATKATCTSTDAIRMAMDTIALVIVTSQNPGFRLNASQTPRVDFYENGRLAAIELGSDWQITAHSHAYRGAADFVVLYGPKGSEFTLYNDQLYRTGQNYVTIVKNTDKPATVWLKCGFSIEGETPNYSYFFAKQEGNSEVNNVSSVGFASHLVSSEDPRIEVFERGSLAAVVLTSDAQISNDSHTYHGNADSVVLHGPKGTSYTFYNDQQFRTGQNYLTIVKQTDAPISLSLLQTFAPNDDAKAHCGVNQKCQGKNAEYLYYFAKQEGNFQLNNLSSVAFGYSIKPLIDEAKTPRIELYEGDPAWSFPVAVLYKSDQCVQDTWANYRGRATHARIVADVPNYRVTFYDDKGYGDGENSLTITVKTPGKPITICLNDNRSSLEGHNTSYDWTFRKQGTTWYGGQSSNYQVDNVSSIRMWGGNVSQPRITEFRSKLLDDNRALIEWTVECDGDCDIRLDHDGYLATGTNLAKQGSIIVPRDRDHGRNGVYVLTVRSGGYVLEERITVAGSPFQPGDYHVYYFTLTNPDGGIRACYDTAILAHSEGEAKALAQAEATNYNVTTISQSEYERDCQLS